MRLHQLLPVVLLAAVTPPLLFPELIPAGIRVPAVLLLGLLIGAGTILRLHRDRPVLAWVAALIGALLVAGWTSPATPESTRHLAGAFLGLATFSVLAGAAWTPLAAMRVAASLVTAGMLLTVVGLATTFIDPYKLSGLGPPALTKLYSRLPQIQLPLPGVATVATPEWSRRHVSPNAVAALALLVLFPSVALWRAARDAGHRTIRAVALVCAAVATAALLLSLSRSGLLAFAITVLAAVARTRWRVPLVASVGVASVGLAAAVLLIGSTRGLDVDSASSGIGSTLSIRKAIWVEGANRLQQQPWFGIGIGAYREVRSLRTVNAVSGAMPVAHAHNVFLQTALDIGLVGLVAFGGLVILILQRAGNTRHPAAGMAVLAVGGALSVAASLLFGALDAIALGAKVGVFIWAQAGLATGLSRPAVHTPPSTHM